MVTLSELIERYDDDPDMIYNVLKLLDINVKYIHSQGYYIRDFNPNKIILSTTIPNLNNFQGIISKSLDNKEYNVNIYQMVKIGLLAYNNMKLDGNMNQEHYNFIVENLDKFNPNKIIPEELYQYYEDVFLNNKVNYLTNYLEEKNQIARGQSNAIRKTLATDVGRAFAGLNQNNDNSAFVNIMFIPSIIALLYLVGLVIYMVFIK